MRVIQSNEILEQLLTVMVVPCGTYSFALEPLTDSRWQEWLVLDRERFEEMAVPGDLFNPDKERRQGSCAAGSLFYCTIRAANGELVGYCMLLRWANRNSGIMQAGDEILFIRKGHRVGRLFLRFMTYLEGVAKQVGAKQAVVQPWVQGRHVRLLRLLGYQTVSYVMEKKL